MGIASLRLAKVLRRLGISSKTTAASTPTTSQTVTPSANLRRAPPQRSGIRRSMARMGTFSTKATAPPTKNGVSRLPSAPKAPRATAGC